MKALRILVIRHVKIFFKDKGIFFTSLIAPLILLFLFVVFLGDVYRDSFLSVLPEGTVLPGRAVDGFAGAWLMSSQLAVCCVTVAFCANMQLVQDKVTGVVGDFIITPCRQSWLALSYFLATALITASICAVALGVGFVYLAFVGWFLSAADIFLILLDVIVMSLFGTALSSLVCFFLKSQGGITAVSVIVSSVYGFLCGAYMPISQFAVGIQKFISLLPGTYGTGLFRNHFMRGVLQESAQYLPAEAIRSVRDAFDCNLYFFGNRVSTCTMFLVIGLTLVLFTGAYIALNAFSRRVKTK